MAKKSSGKKHKKSAKEEPAPRWVTSLEERLVDLERDHRALNKRLKRLTRGFEHLPLPPFGPGGFPKMGRRTWPGPPPGGPMGRGMGGPKGGPWNRGFGPVVSLEIPLETDDPTAPLWATVNARLPEEITTVGDDGQVVRYRYSPVGSTPQAPRYRPLREPESAPRD